MMRRPKLTNEQITKLIREVRGHPCLWKKEHEGHNDVYQAGMAWIAIARQMGLSENAVKQKWKNLRDGFNRMNKNPHSYDGDWPFFEDMLFLLPPNHQNPDIDDQEVINNEEFIILNVEDDVLPHSDEYYDLLFLESLAPYFKRLEPVRRVAMRAKIQDMLMKEILVQNDDGVGQDEN